MFVNFEKKTTLCKLCMMEKLLAKYIGSYVTKSVSLIALLY